jgi:hypothetical protein
MAEEYSGINLMVEFKGADISGQGRKVTVTENAPIPPDIDVSHKGCTEQDVVEGLAGAQTTDATIETVDIYDAITALGSVAINTKDTLVIYPYGKTHTYPMLTLQNARLTQRVSDSPYDGAVTLNASWHAKNSLTRGTYTT